MGYGHLQFEEFLVFVARVVAHFCTIDYRNKAKVMKFVTSDRTILDKMIKEERKDERKGLLLKISTILQFVIADRRKMIEVPEDCIAN